MVVDFKDKVRFHHSSPKCGQRDNKTYREHLYRVHLTPIQCTRCWSTVKTEKELEKHSRAQEVCSVKPRLVQWVPREKEQILKDRKQVLKGQSEEERWKYIYGILFPEDLSLPSACRDP
jgi:hypothetical protein